MTSAEIRESFLDFFKENGHAVVASSSLIPDDPSVLFTTAGMQQFKPYYTGELNALNDFGSLSTASVQKCFRTSDIDEVGDESHLTFFEMLGNFSFGGYFKEKAIEYAYKFIVEELKLEIDYVSVFAGDKENNIPADDESEKIWQKIDKNIEIKKAGKEDNFWGPTGSEGPCGPTTEIYINGVEIWNIVFNEYYKDKTGKFTKVKNPGVDTGMGLERLAMVVQKTPTIFETDLFDFIMRGFSDKLPVRTKRIIADHLRAVAFLTSDGMRPSNKGAGYILRRLIRRIVAVVYKENIGRNPIDVLENIVDKHSQFPDYKNLNFTEIKGVFEEEYGRFLKTLETGMKELEKLIAIDAKTAFHLYESFGLPYETIKDYAGVKAEYLTREDFDKEFQKHQEISRAGAERKFGGHGLVLNTGELKAANEEELKKVVRLHTATHLLQWALRQVFGNEVAQMGSDINAERTRFDFSFNRKMTPEEIRRVEDLVNEKIQENSPVRFEEMSKEEAEKTGALRFFKGKYPEKVKVYSIGDSLEFCAGPHVERTGEIGKFRIVKEESVSGGARRIRAVVE